MKPSNIDFIRLSRDILNRGSYLRFQAKGNSMYPAIKDKDILNVEQVRASQIRIGDVIFYQAAGHSLVAHRVIKAFVQDSRLFFLCIGLSLGPSLAATANHVRCYYLLQLPACKVFDL